MADNDLYSCECKVQAAFTGVQADMVVYFKGGGCSTDNPLFPGTVPVGEDCTEIVSSAGAAKL